MREVERTCAARSHAHGQAALLFQIDFGLAFRHYHIAYDRIGQRFLGVSVDHGHGGDDVLFSWGAIVLQLDCYMRL